MTAKSEKYSKRHIVNYAESYLSDVYDEESEKETTNKSKRKCRQRQENSLGELTKSFISYIKKQEGKEININDVVRQLKVKKRRIYDITNVLEGIGYIRKLAKNKIQWRNVDETEESNDHEEENVLSPDEVDGDEYEKLKRESEILAKEELSLENMIACIKNNFEKLTDDKNFSENGYVTFDDIKALTAGEDINLIAIKAPAGTSLEIPDPEQIHNLYLDYLQKKENKEEVDQSVLDSLEKKYQLILDSPNGEINVFLILNKNEESNTNKFSKTSPRNNILNKPLKRNYYDMDLI